MMTTYKLLDTMTAWQISKFLKAYDNIRPRDKDGLRPRKIFVDERDGLWFWCLGWLPEVLKDSYRDFVKEERKHDDKNGRLSP